LTIITLE
nr:Chain Z, LTIITLE heptapeptide segment from p53 [Homo sapiens]